MKKSKSKPLKVTPFTLYMKQRKNQLEREGVQFPGGWKEVAQFISDEWTGMAEHQKAFWREKAEAESEVKNEVKYEEQAHFQNENMQENETESNYEKLFLNCEVRNVEETIHLFIGGRDVTKIEFPVLHFNSYGPYLGHMFVPSEYALGTFTIDDGFIAIQGRIIDPGNLPGDVSLAIAFEERDKKSVPVPPYTCKPGPSYGFAHHTQSDFEMILNEVIRHSLVMRDSKTRRSISILFTPFEEHIVNIRGCILWLMMKCDKKFDFEILKMTTLMKVISFIKTNGDPNQVGIWTEGDGRRLLDDGLLNYTASLGCEWHQRTENSDKINVCSSNIVSRGTYLALSAFCEIFTLPRSTPSHLPDFTLEAKPPSWKSYVSRIEFRQRFGLIPVDKETRKILRRQFIMDNFLTTLKQKYPDGLMRVPTTIIWPRSRDLEKDLNYSPTSEVRITAPEPSNPPSDDEDFKPNHDW